MTEITGEQLKRMTLDLFLDACWSETNVASGLNSPVAEHFRQRQIAYADVLGLMGYDYGYLEEVKKTVFEQRKLGNN